MKIIAKGKTTRTAAVIKSLYSGQVLKRGIEPEIDIVQIAEGTELDVVAVDDKEGTVTIVHPINPERVLVIAADAVALYNEAVGIWQNIVKFAKKAASWIKGIFKKA